MVQGSARDEGGGRIETRRAGEKRDVDENVPLEPQSDPVNDPDDSRDEDSSGSSVPALPKKRDSRSVFAKMKLEKEEVGRENESSPESSGEEAHG